MTAAFLGVLLLLFGALKVCLWFPNRLVTRQRNYQNTRLDAGFSFVPEIPLLLPDGAPVGWEEPGEALDILQGG